MAYFNVSSKPMNYGGVIYQPGDEIPNFGTGLYDDILLNNKQVESNGEGNGNEDKIAHQIGKRQEMYQRHDSERREEDGYFADVVKYQAEKDFKVSA